MKRSVGRAVASPTARPTHFARRWAAAGVPHWSCRPADPGAWRM